MRAALLADSSIELIKQPFLNGYTNIDHIFVQAYNKNMAWIVSFLCAGRVKVTSHL
jgi:hypothetical protein